MKTIKMVLMAVIVSFGLASCMQGTEEVKSNEDKLEAPADETEVDEPNIPIDEELEDNINSKSEMDSDEDPIMDTMQ
ncbi:hypothetical protein [Owenweeksia hongkongensis]|uniref:hypothetical protein n=1 Tax=Owenweeksia hongkongensis TaxID=253245 RepID=UPI003A8D5182